MPKLTRLLSSLQTQLVAAFVLLILAIAGGTFFFTYDQTKQALLQITRDDLAQIIGIASTQLTEAEINQLVQFQPGQDQTPEYQALMGKLRAMRALSPNVVNFYVFMVQDGTVLFLADDAEDEPALIGDDYTADAEPKVYEAVASVQVSDAIYTDRYGSFLSGYAPIQGAPQGVVIGADMDAALVIERQNFIGNTIYIVMGLSILLAAAIIGVFSLTIIRDIKALNQAAEKISLGDTNVQIAVQRRDEIGDLAESFGRMVASLKIMMSADMAMEAGSEPAAPPETPSDAGR